MFTGCEIVEFFNGHNTDKAHPFIEDCISKQKPLVKVTMSRLQESAFTASRCFTHQDHVIGFWE